MLNPPTLVHFHTFPATCSANYSARQYLHVARVKHFKSLLWPILSSSDPVANMSLLLLFGLVLLFAFGSDVKGVSNGVGWIKDSN